MGTGNVSLGLLQLSAIRELSNIGVGHATTALSEMIQRPLNMSVPNADSVALEAIPGLLGSPEAPAVGIYIPIEGEIGGHMAFLLPWTGAQELIGILTGSTPDSVEEVSEFHASALMEIGNIIVSSFLNAISDMTGFSLNSTPPMMSIEMAGAILEAILAEATYTNQVALLIQTHIIDEVGGIDGFFVYLPTLDGLNLLFDRLGIKEAA